MNERELLCGGVHGRRWWARWVVALVVVAIVIFGRVTARGQSGSATVQPMAANADPSFEVATIKPSDPDHPGEDAPIGHRVFFSGTTIRFLMAFVYDVHDKQIVDAPAWLASKQFDIEGVADSPGTPSLEQVKVMLRKLLVERFGLRFHRDTQVMSAYVLTVGKGGAMLEGSKDRGGPPSFLGRPDLKMNGRNLTMANFAQLLQSGIMDRPVVDHTGLRGKYDFEIRWTPDQSEFGGRFPVKADSADAPPGLFTAIQEQLGLKLSAEKTSVKVMVIDRVEQPSPN